MSEPTWIAVVLLAGAAFCLGIVLGRARQRLSDNQGEAAVRRALAGRAGDPAFHLMNDVTLPHLDGTTQIDHVLVSSAGVFVIESKDYSGWIFGDARSPQWTQVIYHKKSRFQNPIHQNAKHVKAIRALLDFLPPEHVHSIVVFTGDGVFKTETPQGVVKLVDLSEELSRFGESVISENRVQFCVGRIECVRRALTEETDIEHQQYLNRKFGRAI
jgi:hypothetical protein